jgi:hypothetical protein
MRVVKRLVQGYKKKHNFQRVSGVRHLTAGESISQVNKVGHVIELIIHLPPINSPSRD